MTDNSACVICGGMRLEPFETSTGSRLYCLECFHGWRTSIPAENTGAAAMCVLGSASARIAAQVEFVAGFVTPDSAVLEIGCATGELADAVRQRFAVRSYDAIELEPATAAKARELVTRLHEVPLTVALERGDIAPGSVDLILMSHVLEHIDDVASELHSMATVLAPDGSIFIEVPNASGSREQIGRAHV